MIALNLYDRQYKSRYSKKNNKPISMSFMSLNGWEIFEYTYYNL